MEKGKKKVKELGKGNRGRKERKGVRMGKGIWREGNMERREYGEKGICREGNMQGRE